MAKRQGSMATIDDTLRSQVIVTESSPSPEHDAAEPHAAPGINAPTPVTGEKPETRTISAEELAEKEKQSERQKLIDEAIAERERQEQERADKFKASANSIVDNTGRIWNGATAQLGRIPTPGSIILPLVALAVFFFLLLPVNGHTRFVWLWLVLTGNADITGGGASGNFGNTTTAPSTNGASGNFGNTTSSSNGASGNFGTNIVGGGASGNFGGASGTPSTGGGASGNFGGNGFFSNIPIIGTFVEDFGG